jgi:hypothetical protein
MCAAYAKMAGRLRTERAAGYTTAAGRYPGLWQLDDATGAVIRPPNDAGSRDIRER